MNSDSKSPTAPIKIDNKWGWWFYILPSFLDVCPNHEKQSRAVLWADFGIGYYLHNLNGPAAYHPYTQEPLYFIDGKSYNYKDWEKESSRYKFNNKLESILDEE